VGELGWGGKVQALLVFVRWLCTVGKPNVLECALDYLIFSVN
jgi:hypothetical protein